MPLFVSAAGRASRTDEVSPLLCGNGGAEDTASGDDLVARTDDHRAPRCVAGTTSQRLSVGALRRPCAPPSN